MVEFQPFLSGDDKPWSTNFLNHAGLVGEIVFQAWILFPAVELGTFDRCMVWFDQREKLGTLGRVPEIYTNKKNYIWIM